MSEIHFFYLLYFVQNYFLILEIHFLNLNWFSDIRKYYLENSTNLIRISFSNIWLKKETSTKMYTQFWIGFN